MLFTILKGAEFLHLVYSNCVDIEEQLKKYYLNKRTIKLKQEYIEELKKRLETVCREYEDINKTFSFTADLQAVTYSETVVKGGQLPCSDVDRQIESMFFRLENEKKELNNKILETSSLIRQLQSDNDCLDEVIKLLDEESYKIIELRYNRKYSYEKISYELLISVSNIYKKIRFIKRNLIKWINYYDFKKVEKNL